MKTQMRFQKILTLVTLITAALAIVLALLYCSGVIDAAMYYTTEYYEIARDPIGADGLFEFTQGANDFLVIISIVLLLAVVLLYIMGCNKQRNYYKSNYVAIGIFAAIAAVAAISWLVVVSITLAKVGALDFQKWYDLAYEMKADPNTGEMYYVNTNPHYSESVATPVLGIILSLLVLAEVGAWGYNLLWKIKLMKGEKELIANGLNKEVA